MAYGEFYNNNLAYLLQQANLYANHVNVYNNESMWLAESAIRQMTGKDIGSLPPNMQQMVNMFLPNLMNQIPGSMDFAGQYGSVLLSVNNVGMFNNLSSAAKAGTAHTLQMMLNSQMYGANGKYNTVATGGMSASLAGLATGALMTSVLNSSGTGVATAVNMFGEGNSASERIDNMIANAYKYRNQGQMTDREVGYYTDVKDLFKGVESEAAMHAYAQKYASANNISLDQAKASILAAKNGNAEEFARMLDDAAKAYASASDADKKKFTLSAIDDIKENASLGKGGSFSGVSYKDASLMQAVEAAQNNRSLDFYAFNDEDVTKIKNKMSEALPKLGKNVAALSKIFLTDDFDLLKSAVDELGWGALDSVLDVDKIKTNLNLSYAMAAATNRDILSILTERKELTNFAAATSGGKNMVSQQHVQDLQRIRNQTMYNEDADFVLTSDEVLAEYERGYQNDLQYAGNIAASMNIINDNPNLVTDAGRLELLKLLLDFQRAISSGDVGAAELANQRAGEILTNLGLSSKLIQHMGKEYMPEISASWAKEAAVYLFEDVLNNMEGNNTFSSDQKANMVNALKTGVQGLLGTDTKSWLDALSIIDSTGGNTDEAVAKLSKAWNLGDGYNDQVKDLVSSLSTLKAGSRERAYLERMVDGGFSAQVVGNLQKYQENEAYMKDALMGTSTMSDTGDFFTNLAVGLFADDKLLTGAKYITASMIEAQQSTEGQLSDDELLKKITGEGGRLEGSTYLGKLDSSGKVDSEMRKSLDELLKEQGSGLTTDDFIMEGTKDKLNYSKLEAHLNGKLTTTKSGLMVVMSDKAIENMNAEQRRLSSFDNIDMASLLSQLVDGKITKESAEKLLGIEFGEDGKTIKSSRYNEIIDPSKVKNLDDLNKLFSQEVSKDSAGNSITLMEAAANRQKTGDSATSLVSRMMLTIIGYLAGMAGSLEKVVKGLDQNRTSDVRANIDV